MAVFQKYEKLEGTAGVEAEKVMKQFVASMDPLERDSFSILRDKGLIPSSSTFPTADTFAPKTSLFSEFKDIMEQEGSKAAKIKYQSGLKSVEPTKDMEKEFSKLMAEEATSAPPANFQEAADYLKSVETRASGLGVPATYGESYLPHIPLSITRPSIFKDIKDALSARKGELAGDSVPTFGMKRKLTEPLENMRDIFETDFPTIAAHTEHSLQRSLAAKNAMDDVINAVGYSKKMFQEAKKLNPSLTEEEFKLSKGLVGSTTDLGDLEQVGKEFGLVGIPIKNYKGTQVPKIVADFIKEELSSGKPAEGLLGVLEGVNRFFKRMALYSPNYIKINMMGNIANPLSAGGHKGLNVAALFRDYWDGVKALRGEGVLNLEKFGKNAKASDVNKLMREANIFSGSQTMNEMTRMSLGDQMPFGKGMYETIRDLPRDINQQAENLSRAAVFVGELKKGKTVQEATDFVGKTLFNYGDISPFEKGVRQNVIPFATFARKNIPFHLQNLLDNPKGYAIYNDLIKSMQYKGPETKLESGPFTDSASIPMGKDPRTGEITGMPMTNLPVEQLDLLNPVASAKSYLSMLYPALTLPLQYATGQNFFTGGKLEKFPGESTLYKFGPAELQVNKKLDLLLRAFNRPARELSGMSLDPTIRDFTPNSLQKLMMGERRFNPAQEIQKKFSSPKAKISSLVKFYLMQALMQKARGQGRQSEFSKELAGDSIKSLLEQFKEQIQ